MSPLGKSREYLEALSYIIILRLQYSVRPLWIPNPQQADSQSALPPSQPYPGVIFHPGSNSNYSSNTQAEICYKDKGAGISPAAAKQSQKPSCFST